MIERGEADRIWQMVFRIDLGAAIWVHGVTMDGGDWAKPKRPLFRIPAYLFLA